MCLVWKISCCWRYSLARPFVGALRKVPVRHAAFLLLWKGFAGRWASALRGVSATGHTVAAVAGACVPPGAFLGVLYRVAVACGVDVGVQPPRLQLWSIALCGGVALCGCLPCTSIRAKALLPQAVCSIPAASRTQQAPSLYTCRLKNQAPKCFVAAFAIRWNTYRYSSVPAYTGVQQQSQLCIQVHCQYAAALGWHLCVCCARLPCTDLFRHALRSCWRVHF